MTPDPLRLLDALAGQWDGEGAGHYPTIAPFRYRETATFSPTSKPFLEYRQVTRAADDGRPLHSELGYLKPLHSDRIELYVVQPTGFVEIHAGTWDGTVADLSLVSLQRAPSAKDVRSVRRRLVLAGSVLTYDVWMALGDIDEQHHLHAELHRRIDPSPGTPASSR